MPKPARIATRRVRNVPRPRRILWDSVPAAADESRRPFRRLAQAAPALPEFRRKLLLEAMEPRLLLSADPISAAAQAAIVNGLDDFANRLDELDALTSQLPLTNTAIGTFLDLPSRLQTELIAPVQDFFANNPASTADDFVDFLETLAADPLGVTGGVFGDDFQFGFVFQETVKSNALSIDPGDALGDLGFEALGPLTVDIESDITFDVTFGVDLSDGSIDDDDFWLESDGLDIDLSIDATLPDFDVDLGFLETRIEGATLVLDGGLDLTLGNPDGDPEGRLTPGELTGAAITALVPNVAATGAFDLTLPVNTDLLPFSLGGAPAITVSTPNVFTTPPDVSFNADFGGLETFQQQITDALDQGLDAIGAFADSLDAGTALAEDLPLLGDSLASITGIGSALREELIDPIAAALDALDPAAFATPQTIIDALNGAVGANPVEGLTLSDVSAFDVRRDGDLLLVDYDLSRTAMKNVALDFGEAVADLGIDLEGAIDGELAAMLELDLTLGVDLTMLPSVADAFFLRFNGTPTVSADLHLAESRVRCARRFPRGRRRERIRRSRRRPVARSRAVR